MLFSIVIKLNPYVSLCFSLVIATAASSLLSESQSHLFKHFFDLCWILSTEVTCGFVMSRAYALRFKSASEKHQSEIEIFCVPI